MNIDFIRQAVVSNKYEVSQHAERERLNDDLSIVDIENAIQTGEIIEDYPDDPRGASCLVLGWASDDRPVHLVVGFLPNGWIRIVTVYVPEPRKWEPDWKTRKRGGRK
ncbi:DUF4258 domain-containing protein [Desulfovirgula thermocuniculi]|uniref:DUF4258 domain-containing protein n=1 Tax=Desulfovirgula thermocuniculi TaxID=348842 RepID=UPI0004845F42